MFNVVLFEPEIPPNTGNIVRLCANTGARLHLIKPLGFHWEDKQLIRAGLDYREFARVVLHVSWEACRVELAGRRLFALTTRGTGRYDQGPYREGDAFVFGPESRGLPPAVLEDIPAARRIRLPMLPASRSLNLSNAVGVVIYEAWRQCGFRGGG